MALWENKVKHLILFNHEKEISKGTCKEKQSITYHAVKQILCSIKTNNQIIHKTRNCGHVILSSYVHLGLYVKQNQGKLGD